VYQPCSWNGAAAAGARRRPLGKAARANYLGRPLGHRRRRQLEARPAAVAHLVLA